MDIDWVTSPHGRRALVHWADQRPAWLWSLDGSTLVWQNRASLLFGARLKKHGLKLAEPAVPIKGQVARVLRLGSTGRTSLSRIQFLAGSKPVSATCACTPLILANGQPGLLIVDVDAIAADIWAEATEVADPAGAFLPPGVKPTLVPEEPGEELAPDAVSVSAGPSGERVVLEPEASPPEVEREPEPEPIVDEASPTTNQSDEPPPPEAGRLSGLFNRLADDAELFTPLDERDDVILDATSTAGAMDEVRSALEQMVALSEPEAVTPHLFKVTGRRFTPAADAVDGTPTSSAPPAAESEEQQDDTSVEFEPVPSSLPPQTQPEPAETVERVSRYNFDELTRLLTERVNGDKSSGDTPAAASAGPGRDVSEPSPAGSLINLGGETLVLNRLPLGILVFRDQQVLFANRAITEMTGFGSVGELREGGLAAIFPAGDDGQQAGPVNHLVQRDGTLVPVTARLQSISWQGKPALMLSASATEVRTGHEAAVRAFAESLAETRRDGFIEANRNGVVSLISAQARKALGRGDETILGRPLSALIEPSDLPELRAFLERPARFAETARPCIALSALGGGTDILLFAQGQVGIVTGYFGFVHPRDAALPVASPEDPEGFDSTLLARLSRGVRRPLNTIIGFSDLISSSAFGPIDNPRYVEYARDIRSAGQDIAALVDELEDYARLRDGRYIARHANVDVGALLETCVTRVLKQAGTSRVLVRSAISGRLPKVTADRASLTQAVLNLLASAIDQTPAGGAVVISAQREEDGSVSVHVRDSAPPAPDQADRFVVFRDGVGKDGTALAPVKSSVGLALTRSLVAVNAFSLSVEPSASNGTLFALTIPASLVSVDEEGEREAD